MFDEPGLNVGGQAARHAATARNTDDGPEDHVSPSRTLFVLVLTGALACASLPKITRDVRCGSVEPRHLSEMDTQVLDLEGRPIAALLVSATNVDTGERHEGTTDESGTIAFTVSPGRYEVRVNECCELWQQPKKRVSFDGACSAQLTFRLGQRPPAPDA